MATRSILAVVDGTDMVGVYHRYDSYPAELGNRLLLDLLDRKGDLDGAATAWIRNRPGGWISFPDEEAEDERDFYARRHLKRLGWVEWLYLLDPENRVILVYEGNPGFQSENRWDQPVHVVEVDGRGNAVPAVFSAPEPLWHGIPVDPGWAADSAEARAQRQAFVQALERSVPDVEGFARDVTRALAESIDALNWKDPEPLDAGAEAVLRDRLGLPRNPPTRFGDESLRVPFFRSDDDHYWALELGPHRVCFPSGSSFRQSFDPLRLHRADGRSAELDLEEALTADLLAVLPAEPIRRWLTLEWLRLGQVATDVQPTPDTSASPASTRRFELSDGRSHKFWEVARDGSQVTTRWGRIGTRGQTKTKDHGSDAKAAIAMRKTIRTKVAKGYQEAEAAPGPPRSARRPSPFARKAPAKPSWPVEDGSDTFTVTDMGGGIWTCTCPAFLADKRAPLDRTCRHIKRTRRDQAR